MTSFGQALQILEENGKLDRITEQLSLREITKRIKKADRALLFEVTGTEYTLAANVCTRANFCTIFDMDWKDIQKRVITALDNPIEPLAIDQNSFEEVELDLGKLPVLQYYPSDPGPYITSGVFITECKN